MALRCCSGCGPTTRRVDYRFGFASTITPADRHVQYTVLPNGSTVTSIGSGSPSSITVIAPVLSFSFDTLFLPPFAPLTPGVGTSVKYKFPK